MLLCSVRVMQQDVVQKTLVAEDGKARKPARLSWYHPDDTVSSSLNMLLKRAVVSQAQLSWHCYRLTSKPRLPKDAEHPQQSCRLVCCRLHGKCGCQVQPLLPPDREPCGGCRCAAAQADRFTPCLLRCACSLFACGARAQQLQHPNLSTPEPLQPLNLSNPEPCALQMVPRGWWKGGLLADMSYYNPFGWAGQEAAK